MHYRFDSYSLLSSLTTDSSPLKPAIKGEIIINLDKGRVKNHIEIGKIMLHRETYMVDEKILCPTCRKRLINIELDIQCQNGLQID